MSDVNNAGEPKRKIDSKRFIADLKKLRDEFFETANGFELIGRTDSAYEWRRAGEELAWLLLDYYEGKYLKEVSDE